MSFEFGLNIPKKGDENNKVLTHEVGSSLYEKTYENNEGLLEEAVSSSQDFRHLINNVISLYDNWKYSNGEPISKDSLISIINDVRVGRKTPNYITSRYGLRSKVIELIGDDSKANILQEYNEEKPIEKQLEEDTLSLETQEKLVGEYIVAYEEYRKIADERLVYLSILDFLREKDAPSQMIFGQEDLHTSLREKEQFAMARYVAIGEKLTEETKNKYLK
jgi:hypothetical protein